MSTATTSRFTFVAVLSVIAAVVALAFLLRRASSSFPEIPKGGFVGTISGLTDSGSEQFTLYFERITDAPGLLVVVFKDGWKPQVVPLVWQSKSIRAANSKTSANPAGPAGNRPGRPEKVEAASLDPVTLLEGEHSYTLSGTEQGTGFGGDVVSSRGARGSWSVTPISAAAIRDDTVKLPPQFNLKAWLRVKSRHDELKGRVDALRASGKENSTRAVKLDRLVKDQVVIRERSRARRDELRMELSKITEQRRKSTDELRDAVNELGTLTRATKSGQAVELARRIARRETKWFLTHWSTESDPGSVEQELAEQEQVDVRKLNVASKKAEEIEKLRMTISDEQQRIIDLEQQLQGRVETVAPPAARPPAPAPAAPEPQKEQRKPWWQQW